MSNICFVSLLPVMKERRPLVEKDKYAWAAGNPAPVECRALPGFLPLKSNQFYKLVTSVEISWIGFVRGKLHSAWTDSLVSKPRLDSKENEAADTALWSQARCNLSAATMALALTCYFRGLYTWLWDRT